MKILFISPEFKNDTDEKNFHDSISEISHYKDLKSLNTHFLLDIDNDLGLDTVQQLSEFFDRWAINKSPLDALHEYVLNHN